MLTKKYIKFRYYFKSFVEATRNINIWHEIYSFNKKISIAVSIKVFFNVCINILLDQKLVLITFVV